MNGNDEDGEDAGSLLGTRPYSAPPNNHNQFFADPFAHFRAIPWCRRLLDDPALLHSVIVDRRPLPTSEASFVRRVMNSGRTVRACVTFFRTVTGLGIVGGEASPMPVSRSMRLLGGGGRENGEDDKRSPFLVVSALLDLGMDLCGYRDTLHGGLFAVLMDEVMGTAANHQAEHGAYTGQFTTVFRRPIALPQIVVVRGRVARVEGRKIYACGTIEGSDGAIFAEADGIWIKADTNVGRTHL
ncbi:HotDog domain-containing protein [Schizothecium vesticola]|uniref:HotDog domain-containing protein n=1 Tax=Schizothecium vesticola TaxID=314040 RepID=A0AA40K9M0_9PEZI|nr:HotDog domain-containing protein [Schizothecium vesticola]